MPCNTFKKTSFSRGYTSDIAKWRFSDIPLIHEKLIIFSYIRNKFIIATLSIKSTEIIRKGRKTREKGRNVGMKEKLKEDSAIL